MVQRPGQRPLQGGAGRGDCAQRRGLRRGSIRRSEPDAGCASRAGAEIEAFSIIRAIGYSEVGPPEWVGYRDSKSYCAVLLDDNARKPIACLHFNSKTTKYVMTFREGQEDVRRELTEAHHTYAHSETLRQAVRNYA